MQIRLDKLVSEILEISRQDAKKIINSGAVIIKDEVIKKVDFKADTDNEIIINGNNYFYEKFVYIMLNKPKGVVSATNDKNDTTVLDLVKKDFPKRNLFPAGRLDKTSTGFVLLTDDGVFAHDILSPKKHISKTYIIKTDAPITNEVIKGFEDGVTLADGTILKSASIIPFENDTKKATVILHQGVYHQIKRMLGVFDIGVDELHRIKIGSLTLDENLKNGEYKKLSNSEILMIKSSF